MINEQVKPMTKLEELKAACDAAAAVLNAAIDAACDAAGSDAFAAYEATCNAAWAARAALDAYKAELKKQENSDDQTRRAEGLRHE
jgi:hypothetical protein